MGAGLIYFHQPTYIPSFLTTMHTDVSLTNMPSCVTSRIGAKYSLWVHWFTLLVGLATIPEYQIVSMDPVLSSYSYITVKCSPTRTVLIIF